jgi:2-polyprenyl-3-methyl-5-hydroxy-6-metoxy-1,4-benzoquinol methylase
MNNKLTPEKQAAWYDEFHRNASVRMGPWYRFLLPDLVSEIKPETRLLELGCGQGNILRLLAMENLMQEVNIWGVDYSRTAIEFARQSLPKANLTAQDLYQLQVPQNFFHICLLMETIEHLEHPARALEKIFAATAPQGLLYLSFPNYLHLPWLLVRILAEKLNRPNWIVLQPVDKIYTVFGIIRLVQQAGFVFEKGIGSNYGPPVLYPLETDGLTRFLNRLRLWRLSLHPILKFRKPARA